jgi:hypothetical protein
MEGEEQKTFGKGMFFDGASGHEKVIAKLTAISWL